MAHVNRDARYICAQAMLSFLHAVALVRYKGELGAHIVSIVLAMGVFVGQHEGRPFTALKLSQYLRMSRPTVTRRLDAMVSDGIIERRGTRYYVADKYLDCPEAIGMVRELSQIIISACARLPKMDTEALDTAKSNI